MSITTVSPDDGVKLLLKSDDQAPRDLGDLGRAELEALRAAVDTTLARLAAEPPSGPAPATDSGFSCEWWPPD